MFCLSFSFFANNFTITGLWELHHCWSTEADKAEVFCKKGVLKSFCKFHMNYLCWNIFSIKMQASDLQHSCFPLKFGRFLRTPNMKKHLRTAASGSTCAHRTGFYCILKRAFLLNKTSFLLNLSPDADFNLNGWYFDICFKTVLLEEFLVEVVNFIIYFVLASHFFAISTIFLITLFTAVFLSYIKKSFKFLSYLYQWQLLPIFILSTVLS